MADKETKVPGLEERLAYVLSRRGIQKFNKMTMGAGALPGSIIYTDVASAENIRRYSDAIGDFNPRFRDAEYARATKYGKLIAQPTFLSSAAHHLDPLAHEEVTDERLGGFHTAGARAFNSGNEWEYFKPVFEDDRLDFNGVGLIDAKIVKSRFSGQMMVTTSICQYRNHLGEILALAKGFVHHSPSDEASKSQGKYEEFVKPYKYTDEEIARIEADRKKEEMRGSQPRFWEDVNEGDSIGHIVVGPWTIMSFFAWVSAAGMKGIRFPIGGDGGIYDPRINTRTTLGPHADYDLGRAVGVQGNYDLGVERECLVSILFTNWMGDDGFLWKYSIQFRGFVCHGDTCWYRGKITRKYIDDGKYCVDIEHWGENQRGVRVTLGKATIILPSKVAGQVKYPAQRSIEDVFPGK
ncbi:MAG: MaoC family dehydratase N-terminal domain-containing protein [Dehalococcoidales bacterium]